MTKFMSSYFLPEPEPTISGILLHIRQNKGVSVIFQDNKKRINQNY